MSKYIKNRITLYLIMVVIIFITSIGYLIAKNYNFSLFQSSKEKVVIEPFDPENISYMLDGEKITLKNGIFETISKTSPPQKITVKYFGNKVMGDVDGDSAPDAIFILTKQTELGEFIYYIGVVLDKGSLGGISLSPIIIGDRVILQKLYFENSNIVLNYLERNNKQPATVEPIIPDTLILHFDDLTKQLKFVSENIATNIDISKMSITMKPWRWVSTTYNNRKISLPHDDDSFLLTINSDGSLFSTTDCNTVSGFYSAERSTLFVKNLISTKMYCNDSKESEYTTMISDAKEYSFTTKGELQIYINKDNGVMTFK